MNEQTDHAESRTFDFPVGKIIGFQGLKGRMKVLPSTNNPRLLLSINKVRVESAEGSRLVGVRSIVVDKRILLLSLDGYDDRTAVEPLKGVLLYTSRDQLEELEEEEWWTENLIGLDVVTTEGEKVGTVSNIIDTGGCLLEVTMDDTTLGTRLIPFVKDLVPIVDIEGRSVQVVSIPGLLD